MFMNKVGTKVRRFFYRLKNEYLTASNIVEFIALIICLWSTFGAINSMSRNWQLKQKLKDKQLEAARMEIEVEKLKLEQQYLETEEYQELMARAKGGMMEEGETMVILPKNSEEAKNAHKDDAAVVVQEKSNFEQWLELLF